MIRLTLQKDSSPVWVSVTHLLIIQDHPKGAMLVLIGDVYVYVTESVGEIIEMLYESNAPVETLPEPDFAEARGQMLSVSDLERFIREGKAS